MPRKRPAKQPDPTDAISPYRPCIHFRGSWDPPDPAKAERAYDKAVTKLLTDAPGKNLRRFYFADGISGQIEVNVEKRCPTCEEQAQEEARQARIQAAAAAVVASTDATCQMWGRFFQAETYWAVTKTSYHPDYDDPPSAGVIITWEVDYPHGRLAAYGDACAAFLTWLEKTQGIPLEEGMARYLPDFEAPPYAPHLQGQQLLDAYDPWELCQVLPFTPTCCPASLRGLFDKQVGWVYILGIEGSTHLKIGYCLTTPQQRLATLQIGVPHKLSLLAAYPTARAMAKKYEWFIHKLLAKRRQGKTEWFAVDLATVEKAYHKARQQNADPRYFWTYEQWEQHNEEEEERMAEYYEQYPWEDPERDWANE